MATTTPDEQVIERPVLTFPEEVSDWVRDLYADASVILEYGSGGSTVLASELPGKTVYSVESDPDWRDMMQRYLDHAGTSSDVYLHYADIGKVGKWGRPVSNRAWERYHGYPNSVWDLPEFKAPDLVLVDGRFRVACVLTALLRTETPLTLLFDDYIGRQAYHEIEQFVQPVETRGRMARFEIEPTPLPRSKLTEILRLYTKSF